MRPDPSHPQSGTGKQADALHRSQPDISDMLFMTDLGYADDISMPGSTPEELQDLNLLHTARTIL
jgi:hypothetical protein